MDKGRVLRRIRTGGHAVGRYLPRIYVGPCRLLLSPGFWLLFLAIWSTNGSNRLKQSFLIVRRTCSIQKISGEKSIVYQNSNNLHQPNRPIWKRAVQPSRGTRDPHKALFTWFFINRKVQVACHFVSDILDRL